MTQASLFGRDSDGTSGGGIEPAQVAPCLKWAGGKRQLLPIIGPSILRMLAKTGGRYIEPFLGGGAVAFWLGLPGMILNDMCEPLVRMYAGVCFEAEETDRELRELIALGTDSQSYYKVRNRSSGPLTPAEFLYLNYFGYNGLYRENRKGEFNVPHGACTGAIPTHEHLIAVWRILSRCALTCMDFEQVIAKARRGDVAYVDPPYDGGFTGYVAAGFGDDDQRRLAAACHAAVGRGAHVLATNSDTSLIREIYSWAHIAPTAESRVISCGRRNKRAGCLLISNDLNLLR